MSPLKLLTLLVTSAVLFNQTLCSGVFELELLRFQQLDSAIKANQGDSQDVMRIFVCLKEAFTSQLDGPCTFGNSSITLNKDFYRTDSAANSTTKTTTDNNQESQLTNIVRILFTFRWTKSFTIILTTEQIDALNHQQGLARAGKIEAQDWSRATINRKSYNDQRQNDQNLSQTSGSGQPRMLDRHVLTENEVIPNLEQNSNKSWTTRFSRSLLSTLEYKFRVYCSLNYYGDGCTNFCRPRDDHFGHYNCSSTGQKICLEGWEGLDCDKAKCRVGCNQQHGHCDKPNTCQCRPGWTGPRCDECITYPGCQKGYCLSPWQCICQRNWGGVLCDQDLNYCGSHDPCKNNGTCQNIAPGKYKCHCNEGFTGVDCDINLNSLPEYTSYGQIGANCALNPCLNGGTCYGFNNNNNNNMPKQPKYNSYDTNPEADYTEGPTVSDRFYRCQCSPGWTGDYCQWPDSSPTPDLNATVLNTTTITSTEMSSPISQGTDLQAGSSFSESFVEPEIDKFDKYQPIFIENAQLPLNNHVEMKHLISGVVVATVTGVFLASLIFIWCCLIAFERNKFSVIQMNIIRGSSEDPEVQGHSAAISSRLRRVQEKIRGSFRRNSSSHNRIKPETKLSIENVLRPPPSYEESNYYKYPSGSPSSTTSSNESNLTESSEPKDVDVTQSTKESLVIRGALEKKLASATTSNPSTTKSKTIVTRPNVNCPRHGHLYKNRASQVHTQQQHDHSRHHHHHHQHNTMEPGSTCIEIISKPVKPPICLNLDPSR